MVSATRQHSMELSPYVREQWDSYDVQVYQWSPEVQDYPLYPYIPQSVQDIVIPQRQYAVNIQRNHTHSIETVKYFVNGVQGISLRDAQAHNFRGLHAAEDRPLEGFGVKVTYRIEWPGYGSFNRQKHALRATREKESVTRAKMAVHVAEVIKDFIQEMESMHTTEPAWRVGSGYIALEDLYLLEIHQVAKASLQPVIAYRPRVWGNQYPHAR